MRATGTWLGVAALAGMAVYTLLCGTAARWWVGELACNLRWQMGWVAVALGLALLAARRRRLATGVLALAAWHLVPALWLYLPVERPGEGPRLRVATANLLWGVGEPERLEPWLRAEEIDLLALQELSVDNLGWLDDLRERFPYQLVTPRDPARWTEETWGVALLSRHPISDAVVHHGGWWGQPLLEARVQWRGHELHVFGAHPMRPGMPARLEARDEALTTLGRLAAGSPRTIVLGDLNATLYSPAFRGLLRAGRLADSRRGFGRQPSWSERPAFYGVRLPLAVRLDLDHVLVGRQLEVGDRRLGPHLGSDHRPVLAELGLRADGEAVATQPTETIPRRPRR